ncbi:MAG: hypothetical protein RLT05_02715 [Bauldia litoralis]
MTLDPDHVKNAISEAAGIVVDDADAVAIALRLDGYRRAAADLLARAAEGGAQDDFARVLAAAAPRHG